MKQNPRRAIQKAFASNSRNTDHAARRLSRRQAIALGTGVATGVLFAPAILAAADKRKVVVWSEGTANVDPASKKVYPQDINTAIAEGLAPLEANGWQIVKASINDPDQGISDELLNGTDVLIWWGHKRHGDVKDELVSKIEKRVKDGKMGFIGTHSCHFAKPFKKLMGTACSWREYVDDGTSAEIIAKEPNHPICKGVKTFKLPHIERYGEPFAVPTPESVPLDGLYTKPDGKTESARMGLCWNIGIGKVFYFTPGHETYNDYYRPEVRQIFVNAVQWAAP
ncbi:MAG TPA: ThuA domain-containing protein [Candidatus Limnocylindrales bacterium]|nr:ThuA domain-containing protein [Candidatus Limnocylindrales bacterium]